MASLKYLEALGLRPKVDPAPQFRLSSELLESMYYPMSGTLDIAKISPEAIEEAVVKILNKYNVYIPAVQEGSVGYTVDGNIKTFTLDEVINLINSLHTELIDKAAGLTWNTQDIRTYVDKNELIEKLKSC